MALSRYKALAVKIVGIIISLILICLLYMYFSHDVNELNSFYPQNHELKKERPKNWVSLKEISKYGIGAIVLAEDWGFYQHTGFDLNQIQVAFQEMLDGIRFRGASTISQQMVKNVYLTEDRTLWRKIHEVILTQKAEKVLSKDRILEIYLNVIEFGPGIIGIKDASRHYFKKNPSALLPKEAAFLAMMLPSPIRYYASFKNRQLTPFAIERIDAILIKMRMGKLITPAEYQELKVEQLSWEK